MTGLGVEAGVRFAVEGQHRQQGEAAHRQGGEDGRVPAAPLGQQAAQHGGQGDGGEHPDYGHREGWRGLRLPHIAHNGARQHQRGTGAQALDDASEDEAGHAVGQ
ncbi:hypothetical protein D9M68_785700 [compost metagenome]